MKKPQLRVRNFYANVNGTKILGEQAIGKSKNGSTHVLFEQDLITDSTNGALKIFHSTNPNISKSTKTAFSSVSAVDFVRLGLGTIGADVNTKIDGDEHLYIHVQESTVKHDQSWTAAKYRNGQPQLSVDGLQIYKKSTVELTVNGVEKAYSRIPRAERVSAPAADAITESLVRAEA